MTNTLRLISIAAVLPFLALESGNEHTNTTCACSSLSSSNNQVVDNQGNPFSGICTTEFRAEWTSILKKKKMSAPLQNVVNGRTANMEYLNGSLVKVEEKYASGKTAGLHHYSKSTNGESLLNGKSEAFHENGILKYSGSFNLGIPSGLHTWNNAQGNTIEWRKVTEVNNNIALVDYEQTQWYDMKTKKSITRGTANWDGGSTLKNSSVKSYFSFYPNGNKKEIVIYDATSSGIIKQEYYDEKGNKIPNPTTHRFK